VIILCHAIAVPTTLLCNHLSSTADVLRESMRSHGATFRMGEEVSSVEIKGGRVHVSLVSNKVVKADALLYAVGRQGNTMMLNLDKVGITTNKRGLIDVNSCYRTCVPNIYAAGDVVGFPALASVSMEQGRIASNHMFKDSEGGKIEIFPYGM
jgi:NAD(P) transhydrogenase